MKQLRYSVIAAVILTTTAALAGSDAQKTFDVMKALEGTWEGKNNQGQSLKVSFRATAGGSALLSEIHGTGPENMISMIHLDGDRLLMTHYCGAGNQPRMKATLSADGKSVRFDFIDATNLASPDSGHMVHVVFTMADANHHTEEWTFLDHGKEMKEVFTLQRSN
ncbi:MAG TPA: hypothetical protein VLT90_00955 [Terriglobales bacterium]|nr:hypothetical protein [Terriglobales bacterium]